MSSTFLQGKISYAQTSKQTRTIHRIDNYTVGILKVLHEPIYEFAESEEDSDNARGLLDKVASYTQSCMSPLSQVTLLIPNSIQTLTQLNPDLSRLNPDLTQLNPKLS